MDYETDNIIQWIFEKIFDQLTLDCKELYVNPFEKIKLRTFDNEKIYKLINKLSNRPLEKIKEYLTNEKFQEKFLFGKIKKKLYVKILLNSSTNDIDNLLRFGYKIDNICLQLIVLNDRIDILKFILQTNSEIKLYDELLFYCSEFGYEEMYFYLRDSGLYPNISVFNKAALCNSLNIIKDVNKYIGISDKILSTVFQINNNEIILFIIEETIKNKIKINKNLMAYPILNNNMDLLINLEKQQLIDWHNDLYYSAVLSGSIDMVKYVELKLPDIHKNHSLDISKNKKGKITLLLEDMIYEINKKKYFSHTINYAIQSGSLEMVKYIYSKGYGITISNFITAIKQGTPEILSFLCNKYDKSLPFYLVHYFGINSFVFDKIEKANILFGSNRLCIEPSHKLLINDYKKESMHIEMISNTANISEDDNIDPDYLMKYYIFFVPTRGFKFNHRLLTKTRIYLELKLENELEKIFLSQLNKNDQQIIIDALYLFGTIDQVKKLYPLLNTKDYPNQQIIMEILCYSQINKLCYLFYNGLLTNQIIQNILPVVTMINDDLLNLFFEKITNYEPQLKYTLLSGKKSAIEKWLILHQNYRSYTDQNIKEILILDDIELIKKFNIPYKLLQNLMYWIEESDLLEVHSYLKSLDTKIL